MSNTETGTTTRVLAACSNCKWWVRYEGMLHCKNGECRKHAPLHDRKWPSVKEDEWCGDHEFSRSALDE